MRDAISNASADESTSWNLPSISATLRSTTGKPASGPEPSTDSRPFSTPGMYSFGTAPPTISFSNSNGVPGGVGVTTILTPANWPEPPLCFLCTYSCVTGCG